MALDHLSDGLLIIALHLEIGDPAVALSGPDPRMPQQILDRHQRRIGIEQLRRHGVPQLMAADLQTG